MDDDKNKLIEGLSAVLQDPAGYLMLKENCELPSPDGSELLGEELEFLRTDQGKLLLLERITKRLSLDKLIRSHSVVTNMLLRLAIELKVKLSYTSFSVGEKVTDFVSQTLEISPDGNYTDAQLTDISALAIAEIRKMVSVSESYRRQISSVKEEAATKIGQKDTELSSLKKELAGFKTYEDPSKFFFTLFENKRLYLKVVDGVFTPTDSFNEAEMFDSAEIAVNTLSYALSESRNFVNPPEFGVKVWNFSLSEIRFKPVVPKFGDSSILKMERAAASAEAFEDYTKSQVKDLVNTQKVLEELSNDGLVDSALLSDGDFGIELPVKPKKKAEVLELTPKLQKAEKAHAGKAGVKSKADMAARLQLLKQARKS